MPDPKFEGRTAREWVAAMLEAYFEAAFPNCEGFGVSMNGEGAIRKLLAPLVAAAARSEELKTQRDEAVGLLEEAVSEITSLIRYADETDCADDLLARIDSRGDGGRGEG